MPQVLAAPPAPNSAPPAPAAAPAVSVCIANWNCAALLRDCLRSLYERDQGCTFEVVIADNASSDGAADMVATEFPQAVLIRNADNRGFARASNQAATGSRGQYVFFLNNDTVVPPGALGKLVAHAEAHPEVGMFGPRLRGTDGEFQISYRRRPTMGALLHKTSLLRWTRLFRGAYREYRRETFDPNEARPVEVLMGAAVFLSRATFEACGRWDESYGFGVEDIDLSTQVARRGPIWFVSDVEILHYGRVAGRQNIHFAAPNVAIGYVHFFRKAGASRAKLFAYKALVTLDAPLQLGLKLIESGVRRVFGRTGDAEKSMIAARGLWAFLRRELVRFWKA